MAAERAGTLPVLGRARIVALRAMYLVVVAGIAVYLLPPMLSRPPASMSGGIVDCMLVAFWALCIPGLLHPLRLLPVLMWELGWKATWLLAVALPAWRAGRLDDAMTGNVVACAPALLLLVVIPWRWVFARYLRVSRRPSSATA